MCQVQSISRFRWPLFFPAERSNSTFLSSTSTSADRHQRHPSLQEGKNGKTTPAPQPCLSVAPSFHFTSQHDQTNPPVCWFSFCVGFMFLRLGEWSCVASTVWFMMFVQPVVCSTMFIRVLLTFIKNSQWAWRHVHLVSSSVSLSLPRSRIQVPEFHLKRSSYRSQVADFQQSNLSARGGVPEVQFQGSYSGAPVP